MARQDYLGNPITSDNPSTIAAVDDFVGGLLGYETRALAILPAADVDPECCLASTYSAALCLLGETMASPDIALPHLKRARLSLAHVSDREARLLRFVTLWQQGDIAAARRLGEETLRLHPRDLVLLKLLHYLAFISGDPAGMLRAAQVSAPFATDIPQFHGMLAFALEECHLISEAEHAANIAVGMQRREPWAHHALTHIALSQARIDDGSQFLESVEDTWTDLNSFMSTHLWWHRCLFYLSQGRFERVLEIYDSHCWGIDKSYSQDQIGAVSLLARFELAGVSVGHRWSDLGVYLAARADDVSQPFLTMQYLYGLARADRPEADQLMSAVERHAKISSGISWREVALPACQGLLAHARGRYEPAVAGLRTALPDLLLIGGSHAQRDVFELIYLDALRHTGRWTAAQQLLEARRRYDPDGIPLNRALADVYAHLGLSAQSDIAAGRGSASR